jgi:hypothetical protein
MLIIGTKVKIIMYKITQLYKTKRNVRKNEKFKSIMVKLSDIIILLIQCNLFSSSKV